jgi:hypothetical protein
VALSGELREINICNFVELCVLGLALFGGLWLSLREHWNMMQADPPQRLVAVAGNYP